MYILRSMSCGGEFGGGEGGTRFFRGINVVTGDSSWGDCVPNCEQKVPPD